MKDYLSVVVTGEVDSGKSTLIGRFLYDTGSVYQKLESGFEFAHLLDSFEEERKNKLTIDTTQVFCRPKNSRGLIFIDVPGHQELIKNMLCGSSYADMAILVVDAQKSIEPQTERHSSILKFLGIEEAVVVLNKMDLVGFKEDIFYRVKEEVTELFINIKTQAKYFVPISAQYGDNLVKLSKNMAWYKGQTLIQVLNTEFYKINMDTDFRLSVQDIYSINGEKIAVGEIMSGQIKAGDKVSILPLSRESIVKEIKVFKSNKKVVRAPESIGLILDDMNDLMRGLVICKPKLPEVKTEILGRIFCVRPLDIKANLKFRCSTQESNSRISEVIEVFGTANLEPKSKNNILDQNDSAEILLRTETPVVIENFDSFNALGRFVLQDSQEIAAVGIIS